MALGQHKRAVGVFSRRQDAEVAIDELNRAGFSMNKISIIARDADRQGNIAGVDVADRVGNKADEGAAAGALTGGTLGGITGLLVGLGSLAIPGVGPVIVAGEIATVLATTIAGGAIGATAGGLAGALIGLGIPEERATAYSNRVERGDYLVIINGTDEEIGRAEAILNHRGIEDLGIYSSQSVDATYDPMLSPTPLGGGLAGAAGYASATGMPVGYSPEMTTTPVGFTPGISPGMTGRVVEQRKRAVGVFANRREAEDALHELRNSGFDMDTVSVVAKDADRNEEIAGVDVKDRVGNKADEGAVAGAVTGGTVGGIGGLLVGLGALAIPGIGPVMLAGAAATAVATALSGGAIGALAGTLVGALVGLGIPEERARVYNQRLSQGEYLIFVDGTEAEIHRAEAILHKRGIQEWGIYDAPHDETSRRSQNVASDTPSTNYKTTVAESDAPVIIVDHRKEKNL